MKSPWRLEECAACRHNLVRSMIDGEAHLPIDDVAEDETGMAMLGGRVSWREVHLREHRIVPFERTLQGVSGKFGRAS
jgi:hypothetical protein